MAEEFEFELVFALPDGEHDAFALSDAVFEAGFEDALVGTGNAGLLGVELELEGDEAESTILEAARALIFEFENASGSGRSKVLKTMVGMNAEPLTAFFRDVLKNSQNSSFRVMSIRGLVQIGDSTILPVLKTIRERDPDDKVKKEAESAIQELQG